MCFRKYNSLQSVTASTRILSSHLIKPCRCASPLRAKSRQFSSIYEPDGLDDGPEIPEYDLINLRFRGYDHIILDSFTKYLKSMLTCLGHGNVSWPVPSRTTEIKIIGTGGQQRKDTYKLSMYERTIQLQNLSSTAAPVIFDVIRQNLPEGVQFTAKEHDEEEKEFIYLQDMLRQELEGHLAEIQAQREERRKK